MVIIKFNSIHSIIRAIRLFSYVCLRIGLLSFFKQDVFFEWVIFQLARTKVSFVIVFDFISLMFIFTVCLISRSVIIFSVRYMANEKYFSRFIGLVLSFVFSMGLLILRPNRISILLGWDGLGVTSYLLVIYYQRDKSYNAGIITALTNRLGDVGLLLCLALMVKFGSWNFFIFLRDKKFVLIITILIFARITKSAQMPFSAWLPAAMAAPTPVSALVHSSTLVTAGVYLLIRFNHILISFRLLKYLLCIGIFTMFIAGIRAMFETDIKKVIALSTLRQLGVIIIVIGAGLPLIGYFHIISHAFFKALLFMCAGIIIHNFKDYQDIRIMATRQKFIPFTLRVFIASNLSLCGLPFMAGFYSKDLILEIIIIGELNMLMFIVMLVSTALTVIYSCRLVFLVRRNYFYYEPLISIEDYDKLVMLRFTCLFFLSIFGGILGAWTYFPSPPTIYFPLLLKIIILVIVITRVFIIGADLLLKKSNSRSRLWVWFNSKIWFLPLVASVFLSWKTLIMGKRVTKIREVRWNEIILYKGLYLFLRQFRASIEKIMFILFSRRTRLVFIVLILA